MHCAKLLLQPNDETNHFMENQSKLNTNQPLQTNILHRRTNLITKSDTKFLTQIRISKYNSRKARSWSFLSMLVLFKTSIHSIRELLRINTVASLPPIYNPENKGKHNSNGNHHQSYIDPLTVPLQTRTMIQINVGEGLSCECAVLQINKKWTIVV